MENLYDKKTTDFKGNSYDTTFSSSEVQHSPENWNSMLQHLYADLSDLVEKQAELVRIEMKEKVEDLKKSVVSLAIGGSLLLVGLFALVATSIIVLDVWLPLWMASVVVTAILCIVGGVMLINAKKKLAAKAFVPHESIETLGQIKNTFKEHINEYKSNKHH